MQALSQLSYGPILVQTSPSACRSLSGDRGEFKKKNTPR
jgi:hypothetical protein